VYFGGDLGQQVEKVLCNTLKDAEVKVAGQIKLYAQLEESEQFGSGSWQLHTRIVSYLWLITYNYIS